MAKRKSTKPESIATQLESHVEASKGGHPPAPCPPPPVPEEDVLSPFPVSSVVSVAAKE
jgi:hypothetical protein